MTMVPLPFDPDTLHDELKALRDLLVKWEQRVDKLPMPGAEKSADPLALAAYFAPLKGELTLISTRAAALAELLDALV